ncbi:conserved hypothetical protein [Leishmania major strain Friedlin]|uniref:Uncharacterized protein n=1 Tax=Leishmania major TaxID=5664 RepID=Q4QJE4_LEIMA|nr:conserved hypothetical protein [Leishmania major strain Friedlin]CAG9568238.1 hypothetical_protein_-_conserved [Leishmania major strain Friedlin]CAJ01978.1 conserved hypothetical protein [Leishmania major strain Friedlin]|eukprot:XP_001687535.1 conserved hypothetical protein [Leishmania major strain Friedlin]
MEHSVSSRSPSGQWYPQQQQQQQPPAFRRNNSQQQLQWSPVSGTATPMVMVGGGQPTAMPAGTGSAMLGNSGMLSSGSANLCGQPHLHSGMTPQQQMMIMQSMYTPQSQCCAPCCGTQECSFCPRPGEPVDPFCCTPRRPDQEVRWWESIYKYFDWTFFLACVLCVLTIIGFAMVMVTKNQDNIFAAFGVHNATDLDVAMMPYIRWMNTKPTIPVDNRKGVPSNAMRAVVTALSTSPEYAVEAAASESSIPAAILVPAHSCTRRRLFGSFGELCMEDNMYANTFAVQLSFWNDARDTLWILAMVYSFLTVLYAVLINVRRHASGASVEVARGSSFMLPSITPQQQEEFVKMTPQQQQAFIQEFQQQVAMMQQQNPSAVFPSQQQPGVGCCGSDRGIEFYETPFYEFVRFAWLFSGLTTFAWTCNLFISFWSFSYFYIRETTGPLNTFWTVYTHKMEATLIVVTVFLAWPLCNFVLELIVLVALVLPWLVIRSTWKRGIQMYRPALPPSQLPAYIRADMFFMDFQDVKRLGFSRLAWIILTDSEKPFFEGCEDPTVDKDPAMTQLMQQRVQWRQMMASMLPPWIQSPQQQMSVMGPGGAGMMMPGQVAPQQRQFDFSGAATPPANSSMQSPAQYPAEDGEHRSHKRRRHHSTRDRRHADPLGAASMEETSAGLGATGKENSTRHRHRRDSHHRNHSRSRSRSRGVFDGGVSQPPVSDAAVENGAGHTADGASRRRHRRSHSRSHSRAAAGDDPSALVVAAPRSMGDAAQNGGAAAAADLDSLMQL